MGAVLGSPGLCPHLLLQAVLPSSGCDLPAWPSFTTRTPTPTRLSQPVASHTRCPKSPPMPQDQDKSQILGDMGLVAPAAAVGQG